MTTRHNYYCDCGSETCEASSEGGRAINDQACPVVLYLVAGHLEGGGEINLTALDPVTRAVLTSPRQRVELHAACVGGWIARITPATGEAGNPAIAETPAET